MGDQSRLLLIISYLFPPLGGGGVQRVAKFTKYLPKYLWLPTIVTTKRDFRYPIDPSLYNDLPDTLHIIPTPSLLLTSFLGRWKSFTGFSYVLSIVHRVMEFICIIEPEIIWFPSAYLHAKKTIQKTRPAAILSSSSPIVNHLVAMKINKRYHIPWIADFRDEWTQNPFRQYPTPVHKIINQWLEKKVLTAATKVLCVTPPLTEGLAKLVPAENPNKFVTITNGFDTDDFEHANQSPNNDTFTITFTGSMYGKQCPYVFFDAVSALLKRRAIPDSGITINLTGNIPATVRNTIPENIRSVTHISSYQHHSDIIRKITSASVLLMYIDPQRGAGTYTGKIFEYLGSHRPILAIVPPDGVAAELVRKTNSGIIVNPESQNEVEHAIAYFYTRWKKKQLIYNGDIMAINKFTREQKTSELVSILNQIA